MGFDYPSTTTFSLDDSTGVSRNVTPFVRSAGDWDVQHKTFLRGPFSNAADVHDYLRRYMVATIELVMEADDTALAVSPTASGSRKVVPPVNVGTATRTFRQGLAGPANAPTKSIAVECLVASVKMPLPTDSDVGMYSVTLQPTGVVTLVGF